MVPTLDNWHEARKRIEARYGAMSDAEFEAAYAKAMADGRTRLSKPEQIMLTPFSLGPPPAESMRAAILGDATPVKLPTLPPELAAGRKRARSRPHPESAGPSFTIELDDPKKVRGRGATIHDSLGGATYDVVIDDAGKLIYVAVRAHDGLTLDDVRELPRPMLALICSEYRRQRREPGGELFRSYRRDHIDPESPASSQPPTTEYVAGVVRRAHEAGQPARQALSVLTGAKLPTVDKWLAKARATYPDLPRDRKPNTTKGSLE